MRNVVVLWVFLAGGASAQARPAPGPDELAREFVTEYAVGLDNPGLHTVRSLIRALTTRDLFVRVDRRVMARWHRDPTARESWLARLERTADRVAGLRAAARRGLLGGEQADELVRAERTLYRMRRQDAAWLAVYSKARPADYPFILSGRSALKLGVLDGCTTYARTFCLLGRAAGLEVRPVGASNLDTLRGIWRPGGERAPGGVNGHKMALVRLQGKWHLVNTNFHAPARTPSYEIFAELDGQPVTPETLPGTVVRLPSMQVDDGRRSPRLVVTNVGSPEAEDLGEHSFEANLNVAVSGDPSSPLCRNPALIRLLGAAKSEK